MQSSESRLIDQAIFRKSSYSQSEAACVEVAKVGRIAAIRDTQHRGLETLAFPLGEWSAFLGAAR
ncbi:DUF397 domain-containing protein [Nocardiopsis tropica]|uniref:DUF397 domain-containing protein n=1 Tax=Nocardiopsis tropica TaxID=109330 RepID=A0ABU7KWS6_9ACTN|nr:DUF397 domain-containing protein [Nocardiopsis umidischolae]MEE2053741.1 DUF397 domain-containing protein [Nocardiopsis umidischolae]